jgi:hypothetical protein
MVTGRLLFDRLCCTNDVNLRAIFRFTAPCIGASSAEQRQWASALAYFVPHLHGRSVLVRPLEAFDSSNDETLCITEVAAREWCAAMIPAAILRHEFARVTGEEAARCGHSQNPWKTLVVRARVALRFSGLEMWSSLRMGVYGLNTALSLGGSSGGNVYTRMMVGSSSEFLCRATAAEARRRCADSRGTLTVKEMSAAEFAAALGAAEADKAHALSVAGVVVAGLAGAHSSMMGIYARNEAHTAETGRLVLTKEGDENIHLYSDTEFMRFFINDTAAMIKGIPFGWLYATKGAFTPFGHTWLKGANGGGARGDGGGESGDHDRVATFLTVTEISGTALAAARAAAEADGPMREAEKARALAITSLIAAGHTGYRSQQMGTYRLDTVLSPLYGANVYTSPLDVGRTTFHISRGPHGHWYFSETAYLSADRDIECWVKKRLLASTTPSVSPIGLVWKIADFSGKVQDDLSLTVVAEDEQVPAV